jgi:hypothetical protein
MQRGSFNHPAGNPLSISPDSSLIFERSVQAQHTVLESAWSKTADESKNDIDAAAARGNPDHVNMVTRIPTHVLTEDHIPAVLDASSRVIGAGGDPAQVKVVTHAAHQSFGDALAAISSATSPNLRGRRVSKDRGSPDANNLSVSPSGRMGLGLTDMEKLKDNVKEHTSYQQHMPLRPLTPTLMLGQPLLEGIMEEPGKNGDIPRSSLPTKPLLSGSAIQDEEDALMGSAYGASPLEKHGSGAARRLSFVSFVDVVNGENSGVLSQTSSGYSSPTGGITPNVLKRPMPAALVGIGAVSPPLPPTSAPALVASTPSSSGSSGTVVGNMRVETMSTAMKRMAGRDMET